YAPEEQYRTHGEQGPWTDVYALCAVLYRMMTGETPVPAMDRMFQDELKTMKALNTNVSENTETAILKGLSVKKDDRIQSVQELISILYDGVQVSTKKTKESNKKSVAMVAAAVATVGIVGAIFLSGGDKKETSAQDVQNSQQSEMIFAGQTNATVEVSGETIAVDFKEEEEEKKKVVSWSSLTSVDNSNNHAVFALKDGTIASFGMNTYGQRELDDWQDIAAVAVGNTFSAGLCEDGTVYVAGQLVGKDEVERWENIVAITAFDDVLYGLSDDGPIVASKVDEDTKACLEWTDIMAISAWDGVFFGLTEDGTLLRTASDLTPCEITGWEDVDYIFCNDTYIVGQIRRGETYSEVLWEEKKEEAWGLGLSGGSYNGFAQFNFSPSADYDYNGVTNHGEIRGSHYYDVRDLGWTEGSEVVGITSIYDGKCAVGIKEDRTILISTPKSETELLAELTNMKIAKVFSNSSEMAPSVIGVSRDGQLLGYSLGDDTWLSELMDELETSGNMSEIKDIEEVQGTYATLDSNGTIR
ncbi:MAG: hypothetical protein IKK95_02780, partial [Lachnospiraceae bacterium]|nr:hypothetical protein [Lachnospiraceae bacterium]